MVKNKIRVLRVSRTSHTIRLESDFVITNRRTRCGNLIVAQVFIHEFTNFEIRIFEKL